MRLDRAGILANALLVLTLGALALTATTASPNDAPGVPVTGAPDTAGYERVVVVGVPGWSWADIDASTPTLRALEKTGVTGSSIDRGPAAADGADPAGGSLVGQLTVLRRSLEDEGSCVAEHGGLADGLASVRGEQCPVQLLRGPASDGSALDTGVADLIEVLPPRTLLVLTGYSRGGSEAQVHPVLMTADQEGALPAGDQARLRSASTRQPGLVRPADLVTTVLAVAGATPPGNQGGSVVTAAPTPQTDPVEANRDLAIATTLVTRVSTAYLSILAVGLAAALVGATLWARRVGTPVAIARARMLVAVTGSALAAVGVCGYAASWLPWWRLGTDPASDPNTVGLALPLLALLVSTALTGVGVLAVAWAPWVWWVRHRLAPVAVVMSLTVLVIGMDLLRGGTWGLGSVFGLQPLVTGRSYGLSTLTYGVVASAAMLLSACLASMLVRTGRSRTVPVIAVVAVGLATTYLVAASDAGADVGGFPPLIVGTFLLGTAAAGRRLAASSVFLSVLIAGAVVGVVMVADWMRPTPDRTTLGRLVQQALEGRAWDGLTGRVSGAVEVLTSSPGAWLVLLSVALWSYAVLARRSVPHRRLHALWDYPLMHACATTLLVVWVLAGLLNRPGLPLVATGLTLTGGVVLCVVARGRAGLSAASPDG